jgi:hypothetical protein
MDSFKRRTTENNIRHSDLLGQLHGAVLGQGKELTDIKTLLEDLMAATINAAPEEYGFPLKTKDDVRTTGHNLVAINRVLNK